MSKHVLPDVLQPGLTLVFVGTAPSRASAAKKAYYAGAGNAFWPTLHTTGITSTPMAPRNYRELLKLGVGFTDIVKYASGNDRDLSAGDFDGASVAEKVCVYKPRLLAFTSKRAASEFYGVRTASLSYGEQAERIGKHTRVFVLPSPSGQARKFWDVHAWQAVADAYSLIQQATAAEGEG
mmetsp:Transcript_5830/g.16521  ORF Transcript_5830/g.16521 Transcript_5830/m.16521 type:complete len:180 (-) Transcript_5830:38-577(-)|eukprot:CAMPEP_0119159180 /NCGR_PEP_ID=MMETSP1310-20130426/53635_1 /TAXON_ID=464262 /ORGANISM="Genus nov. species nov., Strain RCC2339" /LENGTH=179 /DNA_ID=CAMNT_0007151809 /DNA_START=56 /DNA_END=595 /DNA_ORIENTATION=+